MLHYFFIMFHFITVGRIIGETIMGLTLNIGLLFILRYQILRKPVKPCWKNYFLIGYGYSFVYCIVVYLIHRPWRVFPVSRFASFLLAVFGCAYALTLFVDVITYWIISAGYVKQKVQSQ